MKFVLFLTVLPGLLLAQADPAFEAYKTWEAEHREADYKTRMQALFDASGEWISKWPDSRFAWDQRRASLLSVRSQPAELWKQVDENLIRLSPPHTFAALAAYDWVAAGVNLKDAEALIASEIQWQDAQPRPARPAEPTLADLVDEADISARSFGPLCTLASAQIKLKEFGPAHAAIARIHTWVNGDFKRYYDQDPLETFPDYGSKYFSLSSQLAQAEGRSADALAFYQGFLTNAYYLREYSSRGRMDHLRALWQQIGGTDEGWAAFSEVPPLPPGVPGGHSGVPFLPWVALDYKLPAMNATGLDSKAWSNRDFEGKATLVYLWGKSCGPAWPNSAAIQTLYEATKSRPDMQVLMLSADEDREQLAAIMKEKAYTFPVLVSKPYVEKLLPRMMPGQLWIVDRKGSIRLQRTANNFNGAERALVDEALYKLRQLSNQ